MEDELLRDHLTNQENILQTTRSLHYVFQAIFLGICAAIITIGYTVALDINTTNNNWKHNLLLICLIIIVSIFIIISGFKMLKQYSERVCTRGIIVNYLQHLRLMQYKNKYDIYINNLVNNSGADIVFALIKSAEQISQKTKAHKKNQLGLSNEIKKYFANQHTKIPYNNIIDFKNLNLFYISLFFRDISDIDYSDFNISNPSEIHFPDFANKISEPRKGHFRLFLGVWSMLIILMIILIVFVYLRLNALLS